ncbi:MAG: hypothetical protein COA58_15700 [Bacteroidetes bacterium]|nr:MAG: hypothetical protein COA58_15700 [Bacteroidota bacterium]
MVSFNTLAQDVKRKKYVNPAQVVGVYNFGKYSGALVQEGARGLDNKDIYTLHFLDDKIPTQEIVVPQGSRVFDVESSGVNSAMIFNGRKEVTLVMIAPNSEPEYLIIETGETFSYYGITQSAINEIGEIVLIRSYAENGVDQNGRPIVIESGLEYINVDANGIVTSKRLEKYIKDKHFGLVNVFPTNEGMVYLMEHNGRKKSQYELKLSICDKSGNLKGEYSLTDEQSFFPSDIINDNGKLVMAGYYLNGTVYTAKKTEGLFVTVLDENGTEKSKNIFDWDNMKQKLKDTKRSNFIFNGKMNVMVEKIETTGSGYAIVCESYSTGGGVTGAEFMIGGNSGRELVITVYDFVLFETNANGELVTVNILEKDEANIMMGGRSRSMGAVQMTSLLKKYDVFPFRSYNENTIAFVNYKAKKGSYAELNTSTGVVTEGKPIDLVIVKEEVADKDADELVANSKMLTRMDNMNSKLDRFSAKAEKVGNALEYGIEKVDQVFSPRAKSDKGMFILSDGKVLSYELDQETFSIYYQYLN